MLSRRADQFMAKTQTGEQVDKYISRQADPIQLK